jgi:replication factor C subunit 2/4
LVNEGYGCNQIISQLHDALVERGDISDLKKAYIFEKLAVADNDLMEGADEYLQLLNVATFIMKQIAAK